MEINKKEKILTEIATILKLPSPVDLSAQTNEIPHWKDSLTTIELLSSIEDVFDFSIPSKDLIECSDIGSILTLIEKHHE